MLHKLIATLRKRGAQGRVFPVQASEAAQAAEIIAGVVAQRDELLELLKGAETLFSCHCTDATTWVWLEKAQAAIAKYKPEQP